MVLLALLVIYGNSQCEDNCFGYDADIAQYAVQFASCATVFDDQTDQITSWKNSYCTKAQSPNYMQEISIVLSDPQNHLLAYTAYDSARKMIVVAFRPTICD